jgi:hypothetical protein
MVKKNISRAPSKEREASLNRRFKKGNWLTRSDEGCATKLSRTINIKNQKGAKKCRENPIGTGLRRTA